MSVEYVPGYDWIPGMFGPLPGIPKDQKDQFDRMSDKDFLNAFLELKQEEKESLMVSEAERRRTFAARWPKESIVRGEDCAREGFYYTGYADRVQCTFCGGIVRNWERGDVPKLQHKTFFNYCQIVQNKPCKNIPVDQEELAVLIMTNQLSSPSVENERGRYNRETGVDNALNVFSMRIQTYNGYPNRNPAQINELCDAGFVYEGVGDRVKCFYCNGTLQRWDQRDQPWFEHAKWFPGCQYLKDKKGTDFIIDVRAGMTEDDIRRADALVYNWSDMSFLTDAANHVPPEDAVPNIQPGKKIDVYALLTNDRSEQETNDLLSVIGKCWKCKRRGLPCGVLVRCGHLCLCEACCEEAPPQTCGYCGEAVAGFSRVIFTV